MPSLLPPPSPSSSLPTGITPRNFFIYVNIIHSPRHRVRPVALSLHHDVPRRKAAFAS
ncbi:hypothetical protein V8D89_001011 [Ganoderma adspersum]